VDSTRGNEKKDKDKGKRVRIQRLMREKMYKEQG